MEDIFEIAANISTPLSLAGLFAAVFFYVINLILSKKIIPSLTRKNSALILSSIVNKLFILSLVAMILGFSGYVYSSVFKEESSLQLTIYVHGPHGKQHIVLENTGKLVADFDNDRRIAMIGESGRTNFGEIPAKFKEKEVGVGLEASGYELVNRGKQYKIDGRPIYLAIKKDNSLGEISGVIKNESGNDFISGAIIMIGSDTTITSSEFGVFKVTLPERMQVKDIEVPYKLTIKKEGFKVQTHYYYPKAGDIELRLKTEPI